jgi:hypothetical protein
MKRRLLLCCLVVFAFVSPAVAQDAKTYPEAHCKYTLPDTDWEWLDPQLAPAADVKCIALAKNQNGIGFTLRVGPLAGEKPTTNSFESFEVGFIKGENMKKLAGKQISFKGITAYQIDAEMPGQMETSIRIMYANDSFYALQVINALGPLSATESDPVFQGFEFTEPPQPVALAASAVERGQDMGRGIVCLAVIVVGVVAAFFLLRKRPSRPNLGQGGPGAPR